MVAELPVMKLLRTRPIQNWIRGLLLPQEYHARQIVLHY